MGSKTEAPAPFKAEEVRAWLRETSATVGTRGRIALSLHLNYLQANPDRARQIARQLGTMPRNNQLRDADLEATAKAMSRPSQEAKAAAAGKPATKTAKAPAKVKVGTRTRGKKVVATLDEVVNDHDAPAPARAKKAAPKKKAAAKVVAEALDVTSEPAAEAPAETVEVSA